MFGGPVRSGRDKCNAGLCFCRRIRPLLGPSKHRLWWGPILVKHFRKLAPNQMRLLDAFQDNGWRSRIGDPLPAQNSDEDLKQRLRDTVKDLNRSLGEPVVRFRGDGTGKGVTWEHVCP